MLQKKLALVLATILLGVVSAHADDVAQLSVEPTTIVLDGLASHQQLLVTAGNGRLRRDVTRDVEFHCQTPQLLSVNSDGIVTPLADGSGTVLISLKGKTVLADVAVRNTAERREISFQTDVMPILTARGCSSGPCHGKARGQNGFQLSLFGFDPNFDYAAIVKNARGRRVFPGSPDRSLLLKKGSAQIPHGGGQRLAPGDEDYETLRQWIAAGVPRHAESEPELLRVTVTPTERFMKPDEQQRLLVTAHYADGASRDVTQLTQFQSSESVIVGIGEQGLVTAGSIAGEATMMARFMGKIATAHIAIPLAGDVPEDLFANLPRNNFIDNLVWEKLQSLGITPSPPVDDAKFMRRAYVDIIGRLPSPDEVRAFLGDGSTDKRQYLVDTLLERPEYADHWAGKWDDLLLPNPYRVGIKGVLNYDAWIRQKLRDNIPYDQFVRDLLTAQGSTWRGGAMLFRDRRSPEELASMISQVFLGIRLECAKCHHHPFERWEQADYYRFAAFFSRVGRKGTGLSPPISGSEEFIFTAKSGSVRHPLTDEVLEAKPLFGQAPTVTADDDPREVLAAWLTGDENPFFAQVIVNRIWADLMGRGLVEPVDDIRTTNPPSNGPLLEALAEHFREQRYDLKKLIRTITTSHVYSLSSAATDRNIADQRNFSRHYRQRLGAEVLLDAVCDITQVEESFSAMPPGSRASQLWTRRIESTFLDTFGRPDPNQDPPCERLPGATVTQTLHLMNSPALHAKVTHDNGLAAKLAESDSTEAQITESLYLTVYGRYPKENEQELFVRILKDPDRSRRQAAEDLLWALLNTPEFIYKD